MAFIVKNKETKEFRLFGSLPILCRNIGFDNKQEKSLSRLFSAKKENKFKDEKFLIVRVPFERGGKNSLKK